MCSVTGMHTLKDNESDTKVTLMCEDSGEHLWRECCESNPLNSEGEQYTSDEQGISPNSLAMCS